MAIEFNKQLKVAVIQLRTKLPEAALTYVDLYSAKYGLISKTKSQGNQITVFETNILKYILQNGLFDSKK